MAGNDEFDRATISTQTEIERTIEEINSASITLENYKKHLENVINKTGMVNAQIENLTREYNETMAKFKEKKSAEKFERAKEEGYIPLDSYEMLIDLNKILKDSYSWKVLQTQLYSILFNKIYSVFDDIKALDIKKDALEEMRVSETKRNDLFLQTVKANAAILTDVINNKLSFVDEKLMNIFTVLQAEHKRDLREIFEMFASSMKNAGAPISVEKPVRPISRETSSLKNQVMKKVSPVNTATYEEIGEQREEKRSQKPIIDQRQRETDMKFIDDDDEDDKLVEDVDDIDTEFKDI
jgi:hypothetical protein